MFTPAPYVGTRNLHLFFITFQYPSWWYKYGFGAQVSLLTIGFQRFNTKQDMPDELGLKRRNEDIILMLTSIH